MPDISGYFDTSRSVQPTSTPGLLGVQYLDTPTFNSVEERDAWYRAHPGGYTVDTSAGRYAAQGVEHNNAQNAPAIQSLNPNDPNLSPTMFDGPTNRDVMGGGNYGVRGWMRDHPIGTMAVLAALTYGGAALAGAGGAGAAGGGVSGAGGSSAGSGIMGFGGAGTGGTAANLGADFAGVSAGHGAAGGLAASGGIGGGAGTGLFGSLGGGSGILSQGSIGNVAQLSGMLGGGQEQQSSPSIPFGLGRALQQPQPQQQAPSLIGVPVQQQMPFQPTRGYNPRKFYGATIWT